MLCKTCSTCSGVAGPTICSCLELTLKGVVVSGVPEVLTVVDSRHSKIHVENMGGASFGANIATDILPAKLRSKPFVTGRAPSTNTTSEPGDGPSKLRDKGRPKIIMHN